MESLNGFVLGIMSKIIFYLREVEPRNNINDLYKGVIGCKYKKGDEEFITILNWMCINRILKREKDNKDGNIIYMINPEWLELRNKPI